MTAVTLSEISPAWDFVHVVVGLYGALWRSCAAVDSKRGGCGGGWVQPWSSALCLMDSVPLRDYLGLFQKRFDCLESQMTLLPWFGQHLIFQSRNACTRRPRRIPHPRQYLTQPHLLWSLSRTRVRLSRQPYSYFNSELLFPYSIFFIRDSVASSHNLVYMVIRLLIFGLFLAYFWLGHRRGSRASTDGFSSSPCIGNGTSFVHSLNLYHNISQKPPLLIDHYSYHLDTRLTRNARIEESIFKKSLVGTSHEPPWRSPFVFVSLVRFDRVQRWRLGDSIHELLALCLQGGSYPQGASLDNVSYALCPAHGRISPQ